MNKFLYLISIQLLVVYIANAQYIEDALRYNTPNGIITPRAAALNVAYHGVADDFGALYYNPAGLTLIKSGELSFGLGFTTSDNSTNYLSSLNSLVSNNEYITHAGISIPVKFNENRSAAIAIGYFLEDDFSNNIKYNIFNPYSTLIRSETEFGPLNEADNWAYDKYLADKVVTQNGHYFVTPYQDSLHQSSLITESGGLQNVSGGIAFDLNDHLALGFAITGKWGNYTYRKEFTESDPAGIYSGRALENYVFDRVITVENISQNVSGINATMGLQGRLSDFLRFGIAVKSPTFYQVDESFDMKWDVYYKSGQAPGHHPQYFGNNSYNLRTPFQYSAGLSITGQSLTFAAGVQYSDASQLKFSDAIDEVMALNNKILLELVGQTTWGFGLEYDNPAFPIVGRASYSRTTSPYQQDIPNANQSTLSIGGGIYLGEKVRIDGVMRWIEYSEQRASYKADEVIQQYANFIVNNKPLNISIGVTYRY